MRLSEQIVSNFAPREVERQRAIAAEEHRSLSNVIRVAALRLLAETKQQSETEA